MKGGLFRAALGAAAVTLGAARGAPATALAQDEAPPSGQSERLALHWVRGEGAEQCADGASLARSLEQHLGRSVFVPASEATAWLEGSVRARAGGGFEATLRWVDARGVHEGIRELSSEQPSCEELSEALTLVLAVMIDPEAALRKAETTPATPPVSEREAEPPPRPTEPPQEPEEAPTGALAEPEAPPVEQPRHALGAVARVSLATLPTTQVGLGAFYARDLPHRVRLRVEALAFGKQTSAFEVEGRVGEVQLQQLALVASACPTLVEGKGLALGLCGGVMGSLWIQDTRDIEESRDKPLGTLQLQGGLRASWEGAGVRLGLGAAFGIAVVRQRLYVTDEETGTQNDIYTQGPFGAELDASIAARF